MNYMEFKEHFSILSDTRQERKTTYNFFEVMFQVVTATGKSHEYARF
ncbi:transposase family protein [Vibrio metschnikovii]|nr:transposase family protein [Vibrio metschnikovii]